jgi:hypothetical protein
VPKEKLRIVSTVAAGGLCGHRYVAEEGGSQEPWETVQDLHDSSPHHFINQTS